METLRERIIRHEGLRLKPYRDTMGNWTIGYGRNLDERGITEEEAKIMLDYDIDISARAFQDLTLEFRKTLRHVTGKRQEDRKSVV